MGGFGHDWIGLVFGLVILALAVLAIVALFRLGNRLGKAGLGFGPSAAASREGALEILSERFARGEIDAETFRAMKAELDKN
jgi:uncharacterized membrane protein